jgi:hypothetical protein
VVVHIRRGDVVPCWDIRYLPNSHYLTILKKFPREAVTIFSESLSFEEWDDFSQYKLSLDTPIEVVWRAMMLADVLVMSKSSFSIVPAIFNRHTVVYTPFWYRPLEHLHWTVVDAKAMNTTKAEVIRLHEVNCTQERINDHLQKNADANP